MSQLKALARINLASKDLGRHPDEVLEESQVLYRMAVLGMPLLERVPAG